MVTFGVLLVLMVFGDYGDFSDFGCLGDLCGFGVPCDFGDL